MIASGSWVLACKFDLIEYLAEKETAVFWQDEFL